MNRDELEKLLSRGLDGELDAAGRAELDRRLAADEELRRLAVRWQGMGALLRAPPPEGMPAVEVLVQDARRAIRLAGADAEPAPGRGRLAWASVFVAACAALAIGLGLWRFGVLSRDLRVAEARPQVEWVETDLPGASPMVYEDSESGWVVIWVTGADENRG
jgi:anti-sigma factor RsiW